jgi:hypothetical protein
MAKIYSDAEVDKEYQNASKNGIRFIREQFTRLAEAGIFVMNALLNSAGKLQYTKVDTRVDRPDNETGKTFRLQIFNILMKGENVSTNKFHSRLEITATDDLREQLKKNPKSTVLAETEERTSTVSGAKYLVLVPLKVGTKKDVDTMVSELVKEGHLVE